MNLYISRKNYSNDIVYKEKDYTSLTMSTKDGCLIISDSTGTLEIIPLTEIKRCCKQ